MIYIYIYRERERGRGQHIYNDEQCRPCLCANFHVNLSSARCLLAPSLPANIVGFGGFDSSTILILRGGIPRPIGIS